MYIINTLCDVEHLTVARKISSELAEHLARKLKKHKEALQPKLSLECFSLEASGSIGIIEQGDYSVTAIGLSENLAHIMPEWVSRLELAEETYYVLYIMKENTHVLQVYLPETIMSEIIHLWLSKQPVEEEIVVPLHQTIPSNHMLHSGGK